MALSDSEQGVTRNVRRRAVGAKHKQWSDVQRTELIQLYLMLGNLTLACATLKIPYETARNWKVQQWWKEIEHELRTQQDFEVSAKLGNIVERSLSALSDRIENGDFIYDTKVGKMVRRPIPAKDANKIVNDMLDRRDAIEKKHNAQSNQEVAVDKFIQLAEKFAELAQKTTEKAPVEVTDVIYVDSSKAPTEDIIMEDEEDAVHEEWET